MTFREFMAENGYMLQTTFWSDFSIADRFGLPAVQDTFNRAFAEWKQSYKYLTELILVLNTKSGSTTRQPRKWQSSTTSFGCKPTNTPSRI